ncbi:MAG TPA: acetate--CoA ligase family protein [Conexibacter sp.]|nr:acetate--CoA ligase family protein [Conexibacter sp.]
MTEQPAVSTAIRALFEPTSVAVVGASPTKLASRAALENLLTLGFEGRIGAVNPRYDEVLGVPCAPSLRELDFVPETVVVAVGRDRVVPVIEEAAEVGARAAVVFGIGFAEAGAEGLAAQQRLREVASDAGMAVLGPNCPGLMNFAHSLALCMHTVEPYEPGAVGLIAQSGSIGTALINNQRGVRWRNAYMPGNEAVVGAGDLLGHMVEDEGCRAVCLFLETIRDPERFFAACDRALERDVPVIVLKTGRTEASMRAAEAHSGALAVPDRLVDALFERHGVIRVQTLEEMLETANALQVAHRPTRGTIATMTGSGGQVEMVLDAAEAAGLEHHALAEETVAALKAILPDSLAASNPLDFWGVADADRAVPVLTEQLAQDPGTDMVVAVVDQQTSLMGGSVFRFQMPFDTALELAGRYDPLFVLLESAGGVSPAERVEEAAAGGALLLSGFDTGMRALGHLVAHSRRVAAPRAVRAAPAADGTAPLPHERSFSGAAALEHLAGHGIPIVPTRRVRGADEAVAAAVELGFPVVAKLADEHITHKTEAGGVITGIAGEADLRAAAARLADAGHEELLIQPQLTGVELIMGVTRHPALGGFLVVGLGGIWTEVLGEVTIVPLGLAEGEAERVLTGLRGHELLSGARGRAPVDLSALARILEHLDTFALAHGDTIASLDINPVIATPTGAWAVDALIVPTTTEPETPEAA